MFPEPNIIIIADDDTDDSLFLLQVLLSLPQELIVIAVPNGEKLIGVLERVSPQFIFLDINMPGVSGFEILSFISREPRLSKVPVFVVTSDDQPETIQHAISGGARAVLIKPASVDVLEAALKKEKII